MKIIDVKHMKTAKKYSNALIQSAIEAGKTEKVYNDLVFILETIDVNEELKAVLKNPIVTESDKKYIIQKIFDNRVEKLTLDFILLLVENNRLECLNEIINSYNQSNNRNNNVITPIIISAIELNNEQKERIRAKLEKKTNKKVRAEYTVRPDIIGGLIVEIEDKTIDCSIRTKFENMKKQLIKGNRYGNN